MCDMIYGRQRVVASSFFMLTTAVKCSLTACSLYKSVCYVRLNVLAVLPVFLLCYPCQCAYGYRQIILWLWLTSSCTVWVCSLLWAHLTQTTCKRVLRWCQFLSISPCLSLLSLFSLTPLLVSRGPHFQLCVCWQAQCNSFPRKETLSFTMYTLLPP